MGRASPSASSCWIRLRLMEPELAGLEVLVVVTARRWGSLVASLLLLVQRLDIPSSCCKSTISASSTGLCGRSKQPGSDGGRAVQLRLLVPEVVLLLAWRWRRSLDVRPLPRYLASPSTFRRLPRRADWLQLGPICVAALVEAFSFSACTSGPTSRFGQSATLASWRWRAP